MDSAWEPSPWPGCAAVAAVFAAAGSVAAALDSEELRPSACKYQEDRPAFVGIVVVVAAAGGGLVAPIAFHLAH